MENKYSSHGYIKLWIQGSENEANLKKIRQLILQPARLKQIFDKIYDEENGVLHNHE